MSQSQPVSPAESDHLAPSRPIDPLKNPAYPQRVHVHERARWKGVLQSCDERIATAGLTLNGLTTSPNFEQFVRLGQQMQGARDQIADAVRRLPVETGHLYDEDRHRLEEAVAALDRLFQRWDELGK